MGETQKRKLKEIAQIKCCYYKNEFLSLQPKDTTVGTWIISFHYRVSGETTVKIVNCTYSLISGITQTETLSFVSLQSPARYIYNIPLLWTLIENGKVYMRNNTTSQRPSTILLDGLACSIVGYFYESPLLYFGESAGRVKIQEIWRTCLSTTWSQHDSLLLYFWLNFVSLIKLG